MDSDIRIDRSDDLAQGWNKGSRVITATQDQVFPSGIPLLGEKFQSGWETQTIANYNGAPGFQIGSQFNSIPLSTLLSYSSGLPEDRVNGDAWPPYIPIPYTLAGMLGYLNMTDLKVVASPNMKYTYSNMTFSIMAQILPLLSSRLGSLSFTELMKKYVLTPLGMNDTAFFDAISLDTFPLGLRP